MHYLFPFKNDVMSCDVPFVSILFFFLNFLPPVYASSFVVRLVLYRFLHHTLSPLDHFVRGIFFFFFDNALDSHADVTDTMIVLMLLL